MLLLYSTEKLAEGSWKTFLLGTGEPITFSEEKKKKRQNKKQTNKKDEEHQKAYCNSKMPLAFL